MCVLMEALAAGGADAKRAFAWMMETGKIGVAKIEAARRGCGNAVNRVFTPL